MAKPALDAGLTATQYHRDLARRSRPEYGRFRIALLERIRKESLRPLQVAQVLETAADQFPEITLEECRRYRLMDDIWEPWEAPYPWSALNLSREEWRSGVRERLAREVAAVVR